MAIRSFPQAFRGIKGSLELDQRTCLIPKNVFTTSAPFLETGGCGSFPCIGLSSAPQLPAGPAGRLEAAKRGKLKCALPDPATLMPDVAGFHCCSGPHYGIAHLNN